MLNIGKLMINSLDYILIVDTNYKIIYNTRYDSKINNKSKLYIESDIIGKYYFDIYPKLKHEQSSVARCLETKEVIICKSQHYSDYLGREFVTDNVTLPLYRKGDIIAAVELAMDVDSSCGNRHLNNEKRFDEFIENIKTEAGLITFNTIMTKNDDMKANIEKAKILTNLTNPTLIYGETGTGKELFAQAMINYSRVPKNKVMVLNCAAVPENLIESILFGTVRGAYTGAENKKGLFEEADGGIIFLDELNSMPYAVQAKLLRVLQDGTFKPLGSNKDKCVHVKVIAAMNVEPVTAIEKKIIRKDLFYRFSAGLITLPPLRDRVEDIDMFIDYYMEYFGRIYDKKVSAMTPELKELFMHYSWEGNVRELSNVIESMIGSLSSGTVLSEELLPQYMKEKLYRENADKVAKLSRDAGSLIKEIDFNSENISYYQIMESVEKKLIEEAMKHAKGNKTKASLYLGIPRQTLKYKIRKLHME